MKLKFRKLTISFSVLFIISLVVAVGFRGSIFASDVILTNNNTSATAIDNLSFPGHFTMNPVDTDKISLGGGISLTKAYRIYDGDNIYGEILLSENGNNCPVREASGLMISHISDTFPFISRNRFENGNGKDIIVYREWGTAAKDDNTFNYQNLIIKKNEITWYVILYYRESSRPDVDHMIRSVKFIS